MKALTRTFGLIVILAAVAGIIAVAQVTLARISNPPPAGLASTDLDTCAEFAALGSIETGTCGSLVFSVEPTIAGFISTASSTFTGNATTTGMHGFGSIFLNSERFTDLTGNGLAISGTSLAFDTTYSPSFAGLTLTGNGTFANATSTNFFSTFLHSSTANFGATATSSFLGTGSLGVGSTTPWGFLSVELGTDTYGFVIANNGSSTPAFSVNGVNGDGRVGISSTTPQRALSVGTGAIYSQEETLTDGATITWNLRNSNQARVTLGGNRTLDITNETEAVGQTVRLTVCQDGTGTRLLTWDASVLWPGGTAPTLTTTVNKCDVVAGFVTMATGTPKIFLGSTLNF